MRNVFVAFLMLCSVAATVSAAPKGAITGQVLDRESNIQIAGATVQIIGSTVGTFTGSDGTFTLLSVSDGDVRLRISSIGYQSDTVLVTVGPDTRYVKVLLKGAMVSKGEVVVLGDNQKGQARALSQQKNGSRITNIVAADQIGRFPDQNVGDAMKRIPGIAVQYDQGEARFGVFRGTPGQLNSVMINGERIPSAEAEQRQVQLDLVPADMLRAIEVNKTLTPDMDADAVGGSVNLVTRDASPGTRVSGTLGSGLNLLSGKPMIVGSAIGGTRLLDDKFGVVVSGSYFDHILGSDNIEAEWTDADDGSIFMEEFQIRQYEVRRIRRSLSAGLDYRFDPQNLVRLSAIYNHRDDWENRYRTVYKDIAQDGTVGEIERQTKGGINGDPTGDARLEDQRMFNITLGGEHVIADALRLTWHGTYAKASEDRPNERYIEWVSEDPNGSTATTPDTRKPTIDDRSDLSTFEFGELTEEHQYTEDQDLNGRVDLSFNWLDGEFSNIVKFGGRVRTKSKKRENNFFEYAPTSGAFETITQQPLIDRTKDNFLPGNYQAGEFTDDNALGGYDLTNSSQFEQEDKLDEWGPANFSATENIYGGYVMVDQNIGTSLSAIIGVRIESTNNDYTGNIYDEDNETLTPTSATSSYLDILPSINLRWAATPDLIVRGAWTNTLARPNYYDLVPYRVINREDEELSIGNPDLTPTRAMNFDLMGELYMEPIGILSGGLFYKNLSDIIITQITDDFIDPVTGETFELSQPINGGDATITGVELALQRQLDFLPGALAGFNLYLNYTYATSSTDNIPGREGEDLPLPGNPNHTINASLSYEWAGFFIRVAANYTSDYIDEFGGEAFTDRYYDEQLFVDANAYYAITPQLRIFVDVNNLTNQPLRYYQGVQDRVMQEEFYNARFQAGIKFDM